mmetsp:Transcript_38125/g.91565  ORF Transcript_38125/g.91565 Transcript_38125/m.91565 type:complete len:92 (+) Transcript_38125:768-1043(+)
MMEKGLRGRLGRRCVVARVVWWPAAAACWLVAPVLGFATSWYDGESAALQAIISLVCWMRMCESETGCLDWTRSVCLVRGLEDCPVPVFAR